MDNEVNELQRQLLASVEKRVRDTQEADEREATLREQMNEYEITTHQQVAYLEKKVDNLYSENNQLRNKLLVETELQQKNSILEEQKNVLTEQFQDEVQKNVNLERNIEALRNEVSRLQEFELKCQDLETLESENKAAFQLFQAKLDEVIALQKQNQNLSETLQSVQEKIENNEKLEQRCRELETKNAELSNKL